MQQDIHSLILSTIQEAYPDISKHLILLIWSRAFGMAQANSDIDVMILVDEANYALYKNISVQKWFRQATEDPWLEVYITHDGLKILLEVKFITVVHCSNLVDYHAYMTALPLADHAEYKNFKKDLEARYDSHYEKFLMKAYVGFFQHFKDMKGITEKEDSDMMRKALFIKKWAVLEAFLRLLYVIQKQGYPTAKWLLPLLQTTTVWPRADSIVSRIIDMKTYDELLEIEKDIKSVINNEYMPDRPYVNARWKFLKEFKS